MEVAYCFNGDFEDYLESDQGIYQFVSNKRNQELEYFILWLEHSPLYTLKEYSQDYLNFIQEVKETSVHLTQDKKQLKTWCSVDQSKDLQFKLNSKLTSYEFGMQNQLVHTSAKIVTAKDPIHNEKIYKDPHGVSGMGTWKGSLHRDKIEKVLQHSNLIEEDLLDRKFDFSTCVIDSEQIFYQNHVDEYFQYKGSTFGLNFENFEWMSEYKKNIHLVIDHYRSLGIEGPFSIDSFIYQENGKQKLYTLSEVNARKTMGYIAYKLWKKFLKNYRYCSFKLIPTKQIKETFSHGEIYRQFGGKVLPLSPLGNKFFTVCFAEDSIHDLNEMEDELFFTLLKNV